MGEHCNEINKLLSEYIDGELDSETQSEIDQHMIDCPPCLEFLDSFKNVVEGCRRVKVAEMPDEMKQRLHRFLAKKLARNG